MFPRITEYVHELLKERIVSGDTVIDATMGNGHDTLFLAGLVGDTGKVYAYDIQEQALAATQSLLVKHQVENRVQLLLQSHAEMHHSKGSIAAVVFNLGYLPKSDKKITTKPQSTILAVEKAMDFLKPGGLIILVVYYGHEEGKNEKKAVEQFVSSIPYPDYFVLKYQYVNPDHCPPFIFAIERKKAN